MDAYQLLQTEAKSSLGPVPKPVSLGEIGRGSSGRFALVVQALPKHAYLLVDGQTQQIVKGQRIYRKDKNLLIEVNGEVVVNLTGFFPAEPASSAPAQGTTTLESAQALNVDSAQAQYIFDAGLNDGTYALINDSSPRATMLLR
jgi:hypothetical protein